MIRAINPTSKASLKMQCLLVSNGDIEKAEKLYNFMAKDMPDLPMYDPVPPTTIQQIKDGAVNTMNWLKENKEDIMDLMKTFIIKEVIQEWHHLMLAVIFQQIQTLKI